MSEATKVVHRDHVYLAGAWVTPETNERIEVHEAHTGRVMATVPACGTEVADEAARAARDGVAALGVLGVHERAALLTRMADALEARADEVAKDITREVGMPIALSERIQVGLPIGTLRRTAALADALERESTVGNSSLVHEPVGVVACITPWNYPLHQIVAKVASAWLAGNAVVLKPSEVAPSSAFVLAEIADEVGLPKGALSMITGHGEIVGEALARHGDVDMVSFTGSTRAGKRVAALAAQTVKKVALELGGKSASVVLDDADLARAVGATVASCLLNSGQTCSALTRLLVPRARYEEAVSLAAEAARNYTPGNPLDRTTKLGPLASATQRERVREHITSGVAEGARLVMGGVAPPPHLDGGYYVAPTLFADVRADMQIAREEIFGPVLVVLPHDGDDDAARLANDTPYGLAGAVFSGDDARALRLARRIKAGQIHLNGAAFNPSAPFGGMKQSGIGREYGLAGLLEFTELKSIQR